MESDEGAISTLDQADRRLLVALQANAGQTAQALATTVFLSPSQVARRRQRLEDRGYITSTTARVDPGRLGLSVQAFVAVQMAAHNAQNAQSFAALIRVMPEVTACWTLTGEADYLMRIWVTDLAALNRLIQDRLLPHPAVARVQSQIVMDQLKPDGPFPV
jgi:DNA-binding Lrp family transcriptional regulator